MTAAAAANRVADRSSGRRVLVGLAQLPNVKFVVAHGRCRLPWFLQKMLCKL
jgi:hypothetical protein